MKPDRFPPGPRRLLIAGALSGFIAVAAGAFGAHALEARLAPDRLAQFELAARYQMYHALALLAAGSLQARAAGHAFVAGTFIFCGTVYALAFGAPRWLGAITPLGGIAFLLGWALLAWQLATPRTGLD